MDVISLGKRNLKIIISVGVVVVLALGWIFYPIGDRRVVIAIHRGVEGEALRKLAKRFSDESKISVEVIDWPYDQLYVEEMKDLTALHSRYDVVMMDDPWFPALVASEAKAGGQSERKLMRLLGADRTSSADLFDEKDRSELNLGDFVGTTLSVCRDPYGQGDYYALPFVGNSQLFCYSEKAFGAARESKPSEKDDLDKLLQKGKNIIGASSRPYGYITRVGAGNSIVTDFIPIIWNKCPTCLSPANLTQLDASAEAALDILSNLDRQSREDAKDLHNARPAKERIDLGLVASDDFDLAVQLVKGQASMSIIWSAWAMAMNRVPNEYSSELKDLQFVNINWQPTLGAWLLAIPAHPAHKDDAKAFVRFAMQQDKMFVAAQDGNPPPRLSILLDRKLKNRYPSFEYQLESLKKAQPRPRTRYWKELEDALGKCFTDLYAGRGNAKDALCKVNTAITRILELDNQTTDGKVRPVIGCGSQN